MAMGCITMMYAEGVFKGTKRKCLQSQSVTFHSLTFFSLIRGRVYSNRIFFCQQFMYHLISSGVYEQPQH